MARTRNEKRRANQRPERNGGKSSAFQSQSTARRGSSLNVGQKMIAFLKRLFSKPSIEDQLKEFGGEESPYANLPKDKPGAAAPEEGEVVVFSGRPVGRTFSCYRGSRHQQLSGKTAEELALMITQKGTGYFWKSRGSYPLNYTQNGRFHYFTTDTRGAFIKIVEMNGRFHYAEGFTYSMVSFLLWGESDVLNLKLANQPVQTTAMTPPSSATPPAPLSDF